MSYKYLAISLLIVLVANLSYCQSVPPTLINRPEVDKPIPDFVLHDVHYFKSSDISLADFRGKWLVINFWYRGCVASIESLSNVNALQGTFKDQAQFILIGVNRASFFGNGIEELYERLRKKMGLGLPSVYDSALSLKWQITSFPHIIIIDPNGIVKAITNGSDLTQKNLSDLFKGLSVKFHNKNIEPPPFDGSVVGVENLTYRSLLSHWNGERQRIPNVFGHLVRSSIPGYRVSGVPLYRLYTLAYIGKSIWHSRRDSLYQTLYPYPVIEAKDIALFTYDYTTGKGIYNYELIIKGGVPSKARIMQIMQAELKNIFNCDAFIETRVMPVWKLVAMPGAGERLRANDRSTLKVTNVSGDGGAAGFSARSIATEALLERIIRYIDDYKTPFFDETGIDHRIDITIDALMTNRDQIKKELQKNGLDLIMGEKPMRVLIIREANISDD